MNTKSRRLPFLAGALALSLVAAACGGDDDTSDTTAAAETTAAAAETTAAAAETTAGGTETTAATDGELPEGEVFVTGSSTVEPISIKVGELADELSGGKLAVTVEGPGTGDGFKKFCAGEADISDASRPIKDEEAQSCADAGVEFVELEVAIDGLTVATSPNNTAVECLDVPALYALIGPESEGFANWSDANAIATELGSTSGSLPDAPLTVVGPGEESGTYDTFVEFAITKIAESRDQDAVTRADYTASGNDNVIVEGIEGADTSLGWVGYAYYAAEADRMKALGIDTGDGCVVPSEETIADGSYGFSRSLYIYVNKAKAADNPAVAAFVDLYISEQGLAEVPAAGYVSLPEDRISATADAWAGR
ncbi:MAG: substrate-binding domain-containing protein [Acidimicrobiia bacterium]